jgi:hypothetical protein
VVGTELDLLNLNQALAGTPDVITGESESVAEVGDSSGSLHWLPHALATSLPGTTYSNCKLRKSDGKALPNRLDRCSMPFFKPPANTLDPFQLELCAHAFKQTWFEIAGDRRLPRFQEERLQTDVSAKLCFFAAKGVVDPNGASRPNRSHC